MVDAVTSLRSGVITCLLTGEQRSPEGERTVVERPHGDTLSREPEPINRRAAELGSPSRMSKGSDLVTTGPGESQGAIDLIARI
jgi:hypothetical protein